MGARRPRIQPLDGLLLEHKFMNLYIIYPHVT